MIIDEDFILEEIKQRIDIQYYYKVLKDKKEIKPEWMLEEQKPESFVEQIFLNILRILKIPEKQIISQNRVKTFDLFKEKKYRYPDFKIIKHRKSEKNLLIELEPFNSDIQIGIKQAKEWIQDINIGSFNNAMAINLSNFILIFFKGNTVREKELNIEEACSYISDVVFGKKITINLEKINKITEQFYNQFFALIHGGSYISTKEERISISEENSIFKNLIYDEKLYESEKIEFLYTIFNRLIFIKILMDWGSIFNLFNYLRQVPEHLMHTELNNLFFKTLAVKKENRVNLPKEFENVPFLNGGLFRLTKVEEDNPNLMIEAKYLLKIFEFLEKYSFLDNGADESSLNSEILGYIFEKTIKFRKGTGSYYTHNLICDFICENVLYPHLLIRINDFLKAKGYKESELLENFEEIFMLKEKTLLGVYEKIIKNLKVCDICVGSGAFLLSMGNLLLEVHKRILKTLNKEINETKIKHYIVEYNLYGVDLLLSAIQICLLRLWLWISEDSEEIMPLPNIEYNLRVGNSLLGTVSQINISTVNYQFINKIQGTDFLDFSDPKISKILEELESGVITFSSLKSLKTTLIDLYLYSHDKNTILLKDLIESLNNLIVDDADRIYLNTLNDIINKKNLKNNLNTEFLRRMKAFHWYLEFPQVFPKGFDIIIGNPPYVSVKFMEKIPIEQDMQSITKELKKRRKKIKKLKSENTIEKYKEIIISLKKELKEKEVLLETDYYKQEKIDNSLYKNFLKNNYNWAYKIYDILIPFFERGFSLLKNNNKTYLSFITSNKYLATDYGVKIREDFLKSYNIEILVDISMIKVFKDAAVYPIITILRNFSEKEGSMIQVGRYSDINELGNYLHPIELVRYNNQETNYLIYIPLHLKSFELFDKLYYHPNCSTVGKEFINCYREFDFTQWENYEVFVSENKGKKLGEDYYNYVTNNDIFPFQLNPVNQFYFLREIPNSKNPNNLEIVEEKWNIFQNELLMIKEVALDLMCAIGKNYANIGKIYALKLNPNSDLNYLSNYYFLALFNSKLLDFYFRVIFWNTHLSGGYLNFHFSYLSLLPVLRIDSKSLVYKQIVFFSKLLSMKYIDLVKILLDLLILKAHFPNDLDLKDIDLTFLEAFLDIQLTNEIIENVLIELRKIESEVNKLAQNNLYQIMVKERQFEK
ncbi:hypothetical protein ES706_03784 [subsurface metagenome]